MRFAIRWVVALTLPAMLLTGTPVRAQKKPNLDKDGVNSEKMIKAGLLTGKIAAVYEDKRMIRLQVAVPTLNPGALLSVQQAQLQVVQARMTRNPATMIQAQRTLIQAQANLYTMRMTDVELTALDDVVVRLAQPRQDFDEKGKVRKYTRAELKELKGPDPKVPGYKAEFGDVAADQVVQVSLVKKKTTGPAPRPGAVKPKAKGKNKEDDANAAADLLADNLPQISMIVILGEPAPAR